METGRPRLSDSSRQFESEGGRGELRSAADSGHGVSRSPREIAAVGGGLLRLAVAASSHVVEVLE